MPASSDLQETVDIAEALRTAIEAARAAGEVLRFYWKKIYQTENSSYQERFKKDSSLQTTADIEAEKMIINNFIKKSFPKHDIDSEERDYIKIGESEYLWLIDPLDGTENFVQGIPYFSSSITLCRHREPLLAVVYNPIAGHLYYAQVAHENAKKGYKAKLIIDDSEQTEYTLNISQTAELKKCRAFFIPDFVTKHQPGTDCVRNTIYEHCRRVFDSWSPALDWCLVASGKADAVVTIADSPIRPDAGMFILRAAGGKVTDFANNDFPDNSSRRLVGSNGNYALHSALLEIVNDENTGTGDRGSCLFKDSLDRD